MTRHSGAGRAPWARFGRLHLTEPSAITHDCADLTTGVWAIVQTFEGAFTAVRFDRASLGTPKPTPTQSRWQPFVGEWVSSMNRRQYVEGVEEIRSRIAAGTVYQVNLCRVLSHRAGGRVDLAALADHVDRGNPAPYAGVIDVPEASLGLVCASPEGFLEREGDRLLTRPIKGTAVGAEHMLPKDFAENVMIVDLVRHDLSGICRPGTVCVDHLCRAEVHPGLVHLVSDVSGALRPGIGWPEIFAAMSPPGSVSGAPKHTALKAIADLEPMARDVYCGAVGWVDADRGRARVAVGIRTFWTEPDGPDTLVHFGTGAGITWGSQASAEWGETELKAARLIALASGRLTI